MLIAFWLGGDPWTGLGGFVSMAVFGAVFLFGSRSETLRGLGGPGLDERWAMIDLSATAFAGHVLIAVVIMLWLVDVARGTTACPTTRSAPWQVSLTSRAWSGAGSVGRAPRVESGRGP